MTRYGCANIGKGKASKATMAHNHRYYKMHDVIIEDSNKVNEYYNYADDSYKYINERGFKDLDFKRLELEYAQKYKENTGQTAQKSQNFIKEMVLVTDKHVTKNHFDAFANAVNKEFGLKVLDISQHKDEGHIGDNGDKNINYHAHVVYVACDENTGKTIKLGIQDMKRLQEIACETLEMPKQSKEQKKVRLDQKQYKAVQREKKNIQNEADKTLDLYKKRAVEFANKKLAEKDKEISKADNKVADLQFLNKMLQNNNEKLKSDVERIKKDFALLDAENKRYKDTLNELQAQTNTNTSVSSVSVGDEAEKHNKARYIMQEFSKNDVIKKFSAMDSKKVEKLLKEYYSKKTPEQLFKGFADELKSNKYSGYDKKHNEISSIFNKIDINIIKNFIDNLVGNDKVNNNLLNKAVSTTINKNENNILLMD